MERNETTPRPIEADVLALILRDGVICIDILLQLEDRKLMKDIFRRYPISHLETVKQLYDACRWHELYEWAVAHGEAELADFARHPSIPEANYHEGGFPRGFRKVCSTYYRAGMINEAYVAEALRACTKDPYYHNFELWSTPMQFPVFKMCRKLVMEKMESSAPMP